MANKPLLKLLGSILGLIVVGIVFRSITSSGVLDIVSGSTTLVVLPTESPTLDGTIHLQEGQVLNGVRVTADNFRLDGSRLLADVCFDVIDDRDWSVWVAYLDYADQHITNLGGRLLELRRLAVDGMQEVDIIHEDGSSESRQEADANNGLGLRCDQLSFEVQPVAAPTQARLVIEAVAAYPREGEVCDADYLERLNRALDVRAPGLSAECFTEEYEGGGGSSGVRLLTWPESMNREEAETILFSQDVFLEVHGILGPWEFTAEVQ